MSIDLQKRHGGIKERPLSRLQDSLRVYCDNRLWLMYSLQRKCFDETRRLIAESSVGMPLVVQQSYCYKEVGMTALQALHYSSKYGYHAPTIIREPNTMFFK